jgi:hypothetical protein
MNRGILIPSSAEVELVCLRQQAGAVLVELRAHQSLRRVPVAVGDPFGYTADRPPAATIALWLTIQISNLANKKELFPTHVDSETGNRFRIKHMRRSNE